jgi:hypothetical protein
MKIEHHPRFHFNAALRQRRFAPPATGQTEDRSDGEGRCLGDHSSGVQADIVKVGRRAITAGGILFAPPSSEAMA